MMTKMMKLRQKARGAGLDPVSDAELVAAMKLRRAPEEALANLEARQKAVATALRGNAKPKGAWGEMTEPQIREMAAQTRPARRFNRSVQRLG